jgi:hypothetical protein
MKNKTAHVLLSGFHHIHHTRQNQLNAGDNPAQAPAHLNL